MYFVTIKKNILIYFDGIEDIRKIYFGGYISYLHKNILIYFNGIDDVREIYFGGYISY